MVVTPPAPSILASLVQQALAEDLGRGDITTQACVEPSVRGTARLNARSPLVVCGLPVIEEVFSQIDLLVDIDPQVSDADSVEAGATIAILRGPAASILIGERVALNFMQRMSGVATMTRRYVDAVPPGCKTRITDTRKTTPGLRALERYAVRCGGGHNHREDLSSAVLIKDNHIAAAGGLTEAVRRARDYAPHTCRIECEVDSQEHLEEAISAGVDIVMLDNFSDEAVRDAVGFIAGRALIEVSGGITFERIPVLAELGVDVISVGALTHSSPSCDLGLDWS
jgi:nicotinate-nucleotide pyrophosphorylase (carboxylating)